MRTAARPSTPRPHLACLLGCSILAQSGYSSLPSLQHFHLMFSCFLFFFPGLFSTQMDKSISLFLSRRAVWQDGPILVPCLADFLLHCFVPILPECMCLFSARTGHERDDGARGLTRGELSCFECSRGVRWMVSEGGDYSPDAAILGWQTFSLLKCHESTGLRRLVCDAFDAGVQEDPRWVSPLARRGRVARIQLVSHASFEGPSRSPASPSLMAGDHLGTPLLTLTNCALGPGSLRILKSVVHSQNFFAKFLPF